MLAIACVFTLRHVMNVYLNYSCLNFNLSHIRVLDAGIGHLFFFFFFFFFFFSLKMLVMGFTSILFKVMC
jgi:hypothetical protein